MRITISFLLIVVSVVSVAAQGGGRLELWADQGQSTCQIVESPSGLTEVHMFHMGNISTGGIRYFVVGMPGCWTGATWVGDEPASGLTALGSTQNEFFGISISWGECRNLPVYLGKIVYATMGQSQPCCDIEITNPITEQGPVTQECSTPTSLYLVETRGAIVNGSSACPCAGPVPVEQATWGSIKSLYTHTP